MMTHAMLSKCTHRNNRKQRRNKTVFLFLCIFFCLLSLSNCAIQNETETEQKHSEKTTISWYAFPVMTQTNSSDASGTYEEALITAFEKKNPDITVKLTMLDYSTGPELIDVALKNNGGCDVLLDAPGRIIAYGKDGYLVPVDDMFDEDFVNDVDNQALLDASKYNETAYMYPLSSAPFYMAFNKQMLIDSDVLDLVKEGWTTEDFTAVLKALSVHRYVPGSIFCNGTGGDQATRALAANLYDASVMNEDSTRYTLGDEAGIQALTYLKECKKQGLILNGTLLNGTDADKSFAYKRASFTILWGPNQQKTYESAMRRHGVQTVEVPLPSADGIPSLEYLINGFCVMNHDDQDKIDASKRFVQFACDDSLWGRQNVIHTGCIPVRQSFGDLYPDDARMQKIAEWTQYYAPYYNTVNGFSTMRTAWCTALQDILNDYDSPEGAMYKFEAAANASLTE